MEKSILNSKRILLVDDEQDILDVLKDEILADAPECIVDRVMTHEQAIQLLESWTYDLAVLDIMGVRGFDLLAVAVSRPYPVPVVMLTGHALTPESLKKSVELGARAFLPKEKLGSVVPFLKDVLTYEYGPVWMRLLKQIEGFFSKSWGPYWKKPDEQFWNEFGRRIGSADKQ